MKFYDISTHNILTITHDIQAKEHVHDLLFRLSLDVLPVQASAVPCERVFSSSKLTDDARRCNLSHFQMEMLQNLKHRFRGERISFTENLVCNEHELSVVDVPAAKIEELLAEGRISELQELVDASWKEHDAQRPAESVDSFN